MGEFFVRRMGVSIDFDHEPMHDARKICDVRPDRVLSSESVGTELMATQARPQDNFASVMRMRSALAR